MTDTDRHQNTTRSLIFMDEDKISIIAVDVTSSSAS